MWKKLLIISLCISVLFVFSAPIVSASGMRMGCSLKGSWVGIGGSVFIVSYAGQSESSGTNVELAPTVDPKLGPFFPDAVEFTSLRGVWERTGSNTFAYTQIAYGLDADRNVLYIAKDSGNKTLSEDCNMMTVEHTLEIFVPGDNPFDPETEPIYCFADLPQSFAYRMKVNPMCSNE